MHEVARRHGYTYDENRRKPRAVMEAMKRTDRYPIRVRVRVRVRAMRTD